ncbi:sugar transporter SWEET1 isoform X4 [Erinaceus europaeus]|uniref:Sugar transporter SWEET1 n=1 Tax=Erinaceus europaeus TaxID=9365 RepID=A0A1S3WE75_ERIEU|nr:sugar transporter SWEET1 isoform X4 [Erinaceus europaeus]
MGVAKQAELEHASHFLGAGSGLTSGACPVRGRGSSRVRWPRELDPTRAGMEVAGVGSSLLSGACVFFTLCMFSSSLSDLRHIWMTQNVDRVQFLPFLVMDVNTLGWLSYGALKGDWTIIIVNVVGAVLQTLYVLVYLHYSPRKAKVIQTKSTQRLSLPLTIASLFSSACWTLYGFQLGDPYIMVPNCPGIFTSFICLWLFWKYHKEKDRNYQLLQT